MAHPKYSRNRMAECAAAAAIESRRELPNNSALEALTCEYIHAPNEDTTCSDGSLRRTALLTFRWRLKTNAGHEERCDVLVRTNNATQQGVPLPKHWTTAMACLSLERWCEEGRRKVRDPDARDVQCVPLGQVKQPLPPADGTGAGRTVALHVHGQRVIFLLCAHVQDSLWLCHRGSFAGDSLAEDPFQESDLAQKDIVADAWETSRTKRLRSTGSMNVLRGLVQSLDHSWCQLVAVAIYRAAELRSHLLDQALDEAVAASGFERSPWSWRSTAGWSSQARVTFLWRWTARDGCRRNAFQHTRLDHVRSGVPRPRGMNETDADRYTLLLAVAEMETKTSKAPCRYLGLRVGDTYEPDPQMWSPELLEERRSHASVLFEWQHVGIGGKPHMVTCRLDKILGGGGRRVPMNPLRSCPSGLTFDILLPAGRVQRSRRHPLQGRRVRVGSTRHTGAGAARGTGRAAGACVRRLVARRLRRGRSLRLSLMGASSEL